MCSSSGGITIVRTKSLFVGVALSLLVPVLALAEAKTYKVNGPHSNVSFTIRHFVSEVEGRFTDFEGAIKYDPAAVANDTVSFTIKSTSISTDNEDRNKHLRSADFFEVEKYPTLSFTSTSVTQKDPKTLDVTGDFTLHGVTKKITIPVTVMGISKSSKGDKAGFKSTFSINRKDYGVVWNRALDGGGAMLGDDVSITILVEADGQ
jgi:polyisoprenoid-binding protein YceI